MLYIKLASNKREREARNGVLAGGEWVAKATYKYKTQKGLRR